MNRLFKVSIGITLLFCIMINILPHQVFAAETSMDENYESAVVINPYYADIISVDELPLVSVDELVPPSAFAKNGIMSEEEAVAEARKQLVNRNTRFSVRFRWSGQTNASDAAKALIDAAMEHNGVPTEGDYLSYGYFWYQNSGSASSFNGEVYFTVTYAFQYFTTAEQEAEMNTAVDKLLDELDLDEKTDYEKIWTVYNYIVDHVTYDYANQNNTTYLLQQTAYAALINGTSVCEGYAVLLYRLALELDVDARVMSGKTKSGLHAWNIINIDGTWYYADPTWDDPLTLAGFEPEEFSYFLCGEENFTDHTRDKKFQTEEFCLQYPVSDVNYAIAQGDCGEDVTWLLNNDGTLIISGEGNIEGCGFSGTPWEKYSYQVNSIIVSEGIIAIPAVSFMYCTNLTRLLVPASVNSIGFWAFAGCSNLKEITFLGNAPTISGDAFSKVTATAYYPGGNATWTVDMLASYGGTLTWKATGVEDGWNKVGGKWVYYKDYEKVTSQWVKDGSQWCYIDKHGYMVTNGWAKDGSVWRWMNKYGYITYSKWIHDGYGWCYINSKGYMDTNKWAKDGSKWCYVGADGYQVFNKWVKDGSKWCYIGADGYMVTNKWVKDGSQWCYMDKNGYLVTNGWAKDGSVWRWMNASGYITYSKWVHDGTEWCYINSKGAMDVNKWVKDGKYWAYVGADGYMVKNQWVGSSYVDANGHALTGTHTIDGKKYTFDANGNLIG